MCLAVPGKIIAIEGDLATVDYGGEKREGTIVDGTYRIGDFVIMQGKIVLEKIQPEEVKEWHQFFNPAA